jgi:hypothetical protein
MSTTVKYLQCTASASVGNGLGGTVKYLRRTTSGAVGNGLDSKIKYLRRITRGELAQARSLFQMGRISPYFERNSPKNRVL